MPPLAQLLHQLPCELRAPAEELVERARPDLPDVAPGELVELICSADFRPVLENFARGRRD